MVDLTDTTGLICGFRFTAEGPQALEWGSGPFHPDGGDCIWLHFRQSDVRVQSWLKSFEPIPIHWRELLLDTDPHLRIETSPRAFAGVLGDFHFEFDGDADMLGSVRFYIDEHLIITTRLHALKALDCVRGDVRSGLVVTSPTDILFRFLEDMMDLMAAHAQKQSEVVDRIEDLVLKDRFLQESEELGTVRRLLTRLRRMVDAQRHAMAQLAHRPPSWFPEETRAEVRRIIERLNATFLDLDAIQERARLLQDEIAGRIANATNRNLYIISLLTAIFLPITLISGIFGMNVGGLPWEGQPLGFGLVIGLMAVTIGASLAFMHWRRFF